MVDSGKLGLQTCNEVYLKYADSKIFYLSRLFGEFSLVDILLTSDLICRDRVTSSQHGNSVDHPEGVTEPHIHTRPPNPRRKPKTSRHPIPKKSHSLDNSTLKIMSDNNIQEGTPLQDNWTNSR